MLARKGKLFAKKIGRNWFTTEEAVRDYLSEQSVVVSLPKVVLNDPKTFGGLFEKRPKEIIEAKIDEFATSQKSVLEKIDHISEFLKNFVKPDRKPAKRGNKKKILTGVILFFYLSALFTLGSLHSGEIELSDLNLKNVSADILEPVRDFVRKYLLPEYGYETYLVVDPYRQFESRVKNYESRISELEKQIVQQQQIPSTVDGQPIQVVIRELIPVGTGLNGESMLALGRRIDNVVSLIEATKINLSGFADDFNSQLSTFNSRLQITPTTLRLPPTNTGGTGPLTLNPDTLEVKTLTVSGGSTLSGLSVSSTLSVTDDLTVDTNVLKVDTTNNRVGINTASPEVAFELIGTASISGDLNIGGTLTALGNIGIGTTSVPNQLTVIGSGSFTGQLKATRNPTLAHTGTWPSFTGTANATLYINPSSPVADGNVIAYVSGSDPKFVVDAEGDIYGNNLILTGATSTGTTTIAGDLTVEGNSIFGDASTDKIKFRAAILPYSLSTIPFSVKASASQTVDVFRVLDSDDNKLFTIDQSYGLITASSGFNFALGGSTATVSYSRLGTSTTSHSNYISRYNDLLISGDLETRGTASFGGVASVSGNFFTYGTNTFGGTGSSSFAGSLSVAKGFLAGANNAFRVNANATADTLNIVGGNVGIGTTSPTTKFQVSGSASISTNFEVTGGYASISNTLYVANGGNVGIGTNNPGAKLDVQGGNIRLTYDSNVLEFKNPAGSARNALAWYVTNDELRIGSGGGQVTTYVGGALKMTMGQQGTLNIGSFQNGIAGVSLATEGSVAIGNAFKTLTPPANGLIVEGNVGIGTTNVDAKLEVAGTASISNSFYVISDGNVGIGTTTPNHRVTIKGFGQDGNQLHLAQDNSTDGWVLGANSGNGDLRFYRRGESGASTLTERVRFALGGNVGIGTTTPTSLLTVQGRGEFQGTASASYLLTGNTLQVGGFASAAYSRFGTSTTTHSNWISTASDLFLSNDLEGRGSISFAGTASLSNTLWVSPGGFSGNIGIGTTGPGEKLEVGGNIKLSATTTILKFENSAATNPQITWTSGAGAQGLRLLSNGSEVVRFQDNLVTVLGSGGLSTLGAEVNIDDGTGITRGNFQMLQANGSTEYYFKSGITDSSSRSAFVFDTSGALSSADIFTVKENGTSVFTINNAGNVGIGTTGPTSLLTVQGRGEFQGTASASYLLTGNTLQVGGYSSAAYSRFGTDTTSHSNYITTTNDLLISGDIEVNASAQFDSFFQVGPSSAPSIYAPGTAGSVGIQCVPRGTHYLDVCQASGLRVGNYNGSLNGSFGVNIVINGGDVGLSIDNRGSGGDEYVLVSSDTTSSAVFGGAGKFSIFQRSANITRFSINSSGNVGIGTTSPDQLLELSSADTKFIIRSTGATSSASIDFQPAGGASASNQNKFTIRAGGLASTLGERLEFLNGNMTSLMTIASSGNVGIGTTVPGAKLNVENGPAVSTGHDLLTLGRTDTNSYTTADGLHYNSFFTVSQTRQNTGNTNSEGKLIFKSIGRHNDVQYTTDLLTLYQVGTSGNVGIGTTVPGAAKLQIAATGVGLRLQGALANDNIYQTFYTSAGAIRATFGFDVVSNSDFKFINEEVGDIRFGTSGEVRVTFDENGNVGIGTTGPSFGSVTKGLEIESSGAAPGIRFDSITGGLGEIYASPSGAFVIDDRGSSQGIRFKSGNANTRMIIDSAGNVGIGTTGPASLLHVDKSQNSVTESMVSNANAGAAAEAYSIYSNTATAAGMFGVGVTGTGFTTAGGYLQDGAYVAAGTLVSGGLSIMTRASAPIRFYTNGHTNERVRIDENGNVGIGTTGPFTMLQIASSSATSGPAIYLSNSVGRHAVIGQLTSADGDGIYLGGGSLTRDLVINSSGNVGIGTTVPGAQLDLSTDSARKLTTTTWSTGSDSRIKTQVQSIDNALDIISRVRPVKFHYTSDFLAKHPSVTDMDYYNFIAQEYQQVFPNSVTETDGLLYLNSSNMIPYAIAGIKELDERVASLSFRIEELEKKMADSDDVGITGGTVIIIASGSPSITTTSSSGLTMPDVLAELANAAVVRVKNLWAKGDIIAEGIKKTYYAVGEFSIFNFQFSMEEWFGREITIHPEAQSEVASMFSGSGAQAAAESKLDIEQGDGSVYLATYGVDSARGEIFLSGSSEITGGEAKIFFDFSFTSVISDKIPLKVLLTPTTSVQGQLYVAQKTVYGFVVKSINGPGDGKFDWLAIARRRGYEGADGGKTQNTETQNTNNTENTNEQSTNNEQPLTTTPETQVASESEPLTESPTEEVASSSEETLTEPVVEEIALTSEEILTEPITEETVSASEPLTESTESSPTASQ